MDKGTKYSFLQGAIILSLGMALVKLIGAFFKLPLANVISENGMGYFNTAYNFYAVFFSLATAGFPVAIAKLVAENYSFGRYNDVKMIKKVAMPIFVTLGTVASVIMFIGAKSYTEYIGNVGAFLPIIVLSPTILFCCISSIYRGYFEGLRNMYPTAISEVIEALFKLGLGLSAAMFVVDCLNEEYSNFSTILGKYFSSDTATLLIYSYAAAAAILGVTVGSFFSMVFLALKFKKTSGGISELMLKNAPKSQSKKVICKNLVSIAIPIAIGSLALSLAGLVDQTFLQRRLSAIIEFSPEIFLEMYDGLIPEENLSNISTIPNFLFGCFAYAVTIFTLVPATTQAFAVSALPSLTSAWVKRDKEQIQSGLSSVIKTTCICAFPAGLGICTLNNEIISLLYGDSISTKITADILFVLGIAAIFSALSTPLSAVLQAMGRVDLPVKILIIGLLIKIILNYFLCGVAEINIHGAGISTLACYMFITITQFIIVCKVSKTKINLFKVVIKPLVCSVICAVSANFSINIFNQYIMSENIATIFCIIFSAIIYIISLLLSKTIIIKSIFLKEMIKN